MRTASASLLVGRRTIARLLIRPQPPHVNRSILTASRPTGPSTGNLYTRSLSNYSCYPARPTSSPPTNCSELLRLSQTPRLLRTHSLRPRTFARNCSCARMRNYLSDEISGRVDITQGREVLPTNIRPTHYDLELEPDFKDFIFNGVVSIE
jgi:hypothetical protein